ncbi:MAG: sugar phosphate isomerase/epimerase [Acidobacteria bacterium]|nr:sugar phosphate isomerase/epimerase [Acidobacteriota bacterium]
MIKISMGSWAFSFGPYADDPVPFDRTVKRLSEAGYDGIEICGFPPHITLDRYPTPESRRELTRFLRDHHLGVSGYSSDLTLVNPVSEGNRRKYLDAFRRNVEMCVDIGSPLIRVDPVAAPGSIEAKDYDAAFDRVAGAWREAAEIAQDAGIRVAWEFEPGFVFNKPSEVLAMHARVGHPNFTIMFDTCHAYMCAVVGARQFGAREVLPGGVAELLNKLDGRIGAIHLSDSDGTLHGEETSTHRPFGEGFIDFKVLTPLLLAVPGIDWWCVDLCFWAGSWELVESSREFVVGLLKAR